MFLSTNDAWPIVASEGYGVWFQLACNCEKFKYSRLRWHRRFQVVWYWTCIVVCENRSLRTFGFVITIVIMMKTTGPSSLSLSTEIFDHWNTLSRRLVSAWGLGNTWNGHGMVYGSDGSLWKCLDSEGKHVPSTDLFFWFGDHLVPVLQSWTSSEHERSKDHTTESLVWKLKYNYDV